MKIVFKICWYHCPHLQMGNLMEDCVTCPRSHSQEVSQVVLGSELWVFSFQILCFLFSCAVFPMTHVLQTPFKSLAD